jgi:hypothetical protein
MSVVITAAVPIIQKYIKSNLWSITNQ